MRKIKIISTFRKFFLLTSIFVAVLFAGLGTALAADGVLYSGPSGPSGSTGGEQQIVQKVVLNAYEQAIIKAVQQMIASKQLSFSSEVVQQVGMEVAKRAIQDVTVKDIIQKNYSQGVAKMVQARQQNSTQALIIREIEASVAQAVQQTTVRELTRKIAEKAVEERVRKMAAVEAQQAQQVQQAQQNAAIKDAVNQKYQQAVQQKMEQAAAQQEQARRQAILQQMHR